MKRTILIIAILIMSVSGEQVSRTAIYFDKKQLGDSVLVSENAEYRILALANDSVPALYPDELNGKLNIEVFSMTTALNIIIELNLEIKVPSDTGYKAYRLGFVILNNSLVLGKQNFDTEEIDHDSGVRIDLGNGTLYPISSYYYLDQTDATIDSEINIYLEQSNHSISWNTEITLSFSFEFNYAHSVINNNTVEASEERIFMINLLYISVFIIIVIIMRKSR